MSIQETILRLGPDDHGRALSSDEYAEAEFAAGWSYERVEGRLVVMAPEGTGHIRRSNSWRNRFIVYQATHPGIIEEVVNQAWLRVDGGTDRHGDVGVYLVRNPPAFDLPDQAPDIMVEVVSPGKKSHDRDYVEKRADYHRFHVLEYVISDRFTRRVTVLTYRPDGYIERILTESDVYTTLLLPGLAIPIDEVLRT